MFSWVILLSLFNVLNANQLNICNENNGNPQIKVGLRINEYTVLISTNNKVYRIEHFKFDGKEFHLQNIDDITKEWTIEGKEDLYAFPMHYQKAGTNEVRIIHIRKEVNENVEQLYSYQLLHSKDLTNVTKEDRFSLEKYKFQTERNTSAKGYDPLTLFTLFAKFPTDSIWKYMKTILAFPLKGGDLPNRFFVYYLETPTKQLWNKGTNHTNFRRHIMIGKRISYGNQSHTEDDAIDCEMDWQHDIKSGKCIDQDPIVNASFPITDYSPVGKQFQFDIIEFSGDHYFVKRVLLNESRVEKDLEILKLGTIASIFECKPTDTMPLPTMAPKTNGPSVRGRTPKSRNDRSDTQTAMIWIANFGIIVVFFSIICTIYDLWFPNDPIQ